MPFRRLTTLRLRQLRVEHDFATAPALETLVDLGLERCVMEPAVRDAVLSRWPHARIDEGLP